MYASYNEISNLEPLFYNENIEVLDLEGNNIESLESIEILSSVMKLKILNLA